MTSSIFLAIGFGLFVALSNAAALAIQHTASQRGGNSLTGFALVRHLAGQPLWWSGWIALLGSLIFQALALHFGPVGTVQPLLVTELLFTLVLRTVVGRQDVSAQAWLVSLITTVALTSFLWLAAPHESSLRNTGTRLADVVIVVAFAAVLVHSVGRRGTPKARAALFGATTAVLWAAEALLIKAVTIAWVRGGVADLATSWWFYAFLLVGGLGLWTEQMALHVGPLSTSQTTIVVLDPLVSVALGMHVFHEHLRGSLLTQVIGVVALVVTITGAWVITRIAPDAVSTIAIDRK